MSKPDSFPVIVLYDSHREFNAKLDAALENAHNDHDRALLEAIEIRYEDESDFAELSADEHELIERLARMRPAIGPTDV